MFLCVLQGITQVSFIAGKEKYMAWYWLYKWFVSFRKLPYVNIINWYRQFLYDEWFNSLTKEEQKKEKARIEGLKEKETAGLQYTCLTLSMLVGFYSNRMH